jgi:hypothetical protein
MTDITVIAVDSNGNETIFPDTTQVTLTASPDTLGTYDEKQQEGWWNSSWYNYFPDSVITYSNLRNGNAVFSANLDKPKHIQSVTIKASGGGISGTGKVMIMDLPHLYMYSSKSDIHCGDTVSFYLVQKNWDCSETPYSADQLFNVFIDAGDSYGTLNDPETGDQGSYLYYIHQPFQFIADSSIASDSANAIIEAQPTYGSAVYVVLNPEKAGVKTLTKLSANAQEVKALKQSTSAMKNGKQYVVQPMTLTKMKKLMQGKKRQLCRVSTLATNAKTAISKIRTTVKTMDANEQAQTCSDATNDPDTLIIRGNQPELVVYQKVEKEKYLITKEPKMPDDVVLCAFLKNAPKDVSINYFWTLKVKWVDPFGTPWEKDFERAITIDPPKSSMDIWTVDWRDASGDEFFVGGNEITIEARATIGSKEYKAKPIVNEFKILGKNPDLADAYSGLNIYERKIMKHESQYQQFNSSDGYPKVHVNSKNEMPSADYGIMMINTSNKPTSEDVWNWMKNKAHGIYLMYDAEDYAEKWPAAIRANNFNRKQHVDVSSDIFRKCPDFTADEQLWKETYARYNGCSIKTHYWMWYPPDEKNPTAESGWIADGNNDAASQYADDVWNVVP